jgi:dephospho-CoA kinase
MRIFGITGGIGAGKSEAARAFERRGIPVIDADRVGHAVIEPGGAAHEALLRAFGDGILAEDGSIDRARIAARAFADPNARRQLNAITHPAIYAEIARRCAELGEQGAQTVLVEAALLGEKGMVNPMAEDRGDSSCRGGIHLATTGPRACPGPPLKGAGREVVGEEHIPPRPDHTPAQVPLRRGWPEGPGDVDHRANAQPHHNPATPAVPLLFDGLILVSCPVAERMRRLVEERGMDPAEAERRIAAQSDPESKRAVATWVIDNGGNLDHLQNHVDAILAELAEQH